LAAGAGKYAPETKAITAAHMIVTVAIRKPSLFMYVSPSIVINLQLFDPHAGIWFSQDFDTLRPICYVWPYNTPRLQSEGLALQAEKNG
jgi:hypothetical protein